ncbi:PAS domain S-box-containing protein [Geoalkalibacter ferrihydriticus]|uniref:histidine kinase n=1 Tax=Geoalkalibacter ferrihydriticus TaxID=392333 RepID=A0A1G9WVT9_9BACT|nr:PAS domain S-box protein [Geoalkalibacter ferrihydriticus]SDM88539.1 PAS domain S-box-containing protein [Geoalkalibacter ferrihydriticus]
MTQDKSGSNSDVDPPHRFEYPGVSFLLIALFWTLAIGAMAGWHYYHASRAALDNARTAARHSFGKDLTFRRWATSHGGVYVPVTANTPPNPYLTHVFERDITTPSGRDLTLVNPAYMLRQMHEMADELFGTRGHITSLKPLRWENSPDAWEVEALQEFLTGSIEWSTRSQIEGEDYLRLMRPLMVESGCLKCHDQQGYQLGDILGGVSVAIPWAPYRQALAAALRAYVLGYGGLWLVGLILLEGNRRRLRDHLEGRLDSEKRYRQLFISNPQPMWIYDLDTLAFLAVNDAAVRRYGYSREEFLAMTIKDIRPLEDVAGLLHNVANVQSGFDEAGVWVHIKKDGTVMDVEITSHTLEFDRHRAEMVLVQDVTERLRAEKILRDNEKRLQHWHELLQYIVAHDTSAIVVFDKNLNFLFVSDRFLTDYRVKKKDIIGKHHYEIFPDIPEKWRRIHQRVLQGESLGEEEDRFEREDGRIDYTRWQCRPWYESDGSIGGIIIYTEVITERIEAREELKQRTLELQERSAELERFNYTVSHDLKSPLVTVKSFLGFLEQDLKRQDDERIRLDIDYMRAATQKMGQLLDDLLEMSRHGRIVNPSVNVSFSELMRETLTLVAGPITERGVEIQMGDDMPDLFGDPPRLVEIWQNLLENAVKYMGDQEHPRIEIGAEMQGKEMVFFVRDNGIGIDERYFDKIFGLFEKLDKQTEGSGLGLALVKRIVGLYKGRIWVESQGVGKGSCFNFTLPDAVEFKEGKQL